jgi:hypothetical protein
MRGIYLEDFLLPSSQLTQLFINCDYADQCIEILHVTPNIINCKLHARYASFRYLGPHVHATQLKSLEFHAHKSIIATIFDALSLPAVQEITGYGGGSIFPHISFLSLITRSSCLLQSLSLDSFQMLESDLIECLRNIPSLHELSIINLDITNETFRVLHSTPGLPSCLLPELRRFHYVSNLVLDFHVLASFLKSRSGCNDAMPVHGEQFATPLLESVEIDSLQEAGVPNPQTLAILQCLVRCGMRITIITSEETWPWP